MDIYAIIGILATAVVAYLTVRVVEFIEQLKQNQKFALIVSVAQQGVLFVEQKYPDLFGDQKLTVCIEWVLNELAIRGIDLDEERITPIIEAQVRYLLNAIHEEFIEAVSMEPKSE